MPVVGLSTPLQSRVDAKQIEVEGATVGEALQSLEMAHPRLAGWLLDDQRRLREHVNVFVLGERVELDQPIVQGDELFVIQAISGGAPRRKPRAD